jgi:hypothetical protein
MTQTNFEPNLSFVTLAEDGYTLLLNGESNYSIRLPMDISKKKGTDRLNAIESTILNACNSFGLDIVNRENVRHKAGQVEDLLDERWAKARTGMMLRPQIESLDITSDGLRQQGFILKKEGQTAVLCDKNKGCNCRLAIYKNDWGKTQRLIEKTLEVRGYGRLTTSLVLENISDEYPAYVNGNPAGDPGNRNVATLQIEKPLDRLDDIDMEKWRNELLAKHNTLQEIIKSSIVPLPQLLLALEFALSVKNVLNIFDNTLPFAGFLLGAPSSLKTVVVELFRTYWHSKYTDDFSPKAFVSHYSGHPKEKLEEIDLLPKIRFKFFLTPELAPLFTGKDDELAKSFGNLTRILDGKGFESSSGTQGDRGYHGNFMFSWLGAVVDISSRVHRMMGNLGPKMYFLRLNKSYETEQDLMKQLENPKFVQDREKIEKALLDYLKWFEACPIMEVKEGGLPKMAWDSSKDDVKARRQIARLALLIKRLRGVVNVEDTEDTQGSSYGYTVPIIEESWRANQQLYNLARGHALIEGRNYIALEDIPLLIKVVLSTAPITRVAVFEMLIANDGTLKTLDIQEGIGISHHTVHKAMTELELLGLVDVQEEGDYDTAPKIITLKPEYNWCLGRQFKQLRQGFSPTKKGRKRAFFSKRSSNRGDNVDKDPISLEEKSAPLSENNFFFWWTYTELEKQSPDGKASENVFRQRLIASGKYTAPEATQAIIDAIDKGELRRMEYDVIVKNSVYNCTD